MFDVIVFLILFSFILQFIIHFESLKIFQQFYWITIFLWIILFTFWILLCDIAEKLLIHKERKYHRIRSQILIIRNMRIVMQLIVSNRCSLIHTVLLKLIPVDLVTNRMILTTYRYLWINKRWTINNKFQSVHRERKDQVIRNSSKSTVVWIWNNFSLCISGQFHVN